MFERKKESFFHNGYVEYWQNKALDIKDEEVISFFIDQLEIKEKDVVLDLGCGHGRLFPIIAKHTKNILGLDVTYEAINTAVKSPYLCLVRSSAEETNFPSGFFDKIIAWAVYDVVDQETALIEQNRILKDGGHLLITGKNHNYEPNDKKAFIAERNARLKEFPNHFTNVSKLLRITEKFGFELIKGYGAPMRDDFCRMVYFDLSKEENRYYYDYLLVLKKIGCSVKEKNKICDDYSMTAIQLAKENQFEDVDSFFRWHKDKYGDK